MTFGEKLKVLRKEKGCSQEEFAELVHVSRQAVSKWESDRGMPEIQTLLLISNMFGVTLDYLLKEESGGEEKKSGGYYVSREMIDGFLSYKRQWAVRIAAGAGLLTAADAFACFESYRRALLVPYWGCGAAGIAILAWTYFQPRRYEEIYTKPLVFDDGVIKDFREESGRNRKKYAGMLAAGIVLLLFGPELGFLVRDVLGREAGNALGWVLDAAAVMLLIIAYTSIRAENVLLQRETYLKRKQSRGKFPWIYMAVPITAAGVWAGGVTGAWSLFAPIILLLCALLLLVYVALVERRDPR